MFIAVVGSVVQISPKVTECFNEQKKHKKFVDMLLSVIGKWMQDEFFWNHGKLQGENCTIALHIFSQWST